MASATPSASSETSFPAFRGSPLWVDTTARRERWWFADGAWVDQGKLGAPVSFGLTHWCADRGLQGPTFDEAFALELHTSILRAQGSPDDVGHGEFPWFGVQILQERRLIADVYECGDVEQIVTALLERGPVLTALSWASDFMSDEVTAGAPIVRMSKGGTSSGTHMVLFNGIDLDLELDGVTGFARFKNTWGRGWADHGHALMSLDVLRAAFAGTAYLPLPEASALRTGVSPEVAIPAERPPGLGGGAGEVESFGEQSIGSDRWTTRDRMGYGAHADAIARAIAHPETVPPLTIGIRAPWGAGKTSLMRMIQERLEWPTGPPPAGAPAALREIHLKGVGAGRVTHGMLLRAARGAEPARPLAATPKIESGHEAQDEARWRPTVWFNPWMYQTGEQIWAGLAHEIIRQVTERMGPGEREQFWLRLNLKRIDEQAVRRRIYTLVLARVLPWAAGALAMLLAGLVLLATGALTAVGAALTAAGPVVAAVASAASARRVLAERARGAVSEALGPTGFADLVRTPEYERQSGSLFLVQTDLVRVLELIATPGRPLVVFVDDLDRCNPGTVVQVIEAINLFVAGEYPNSIFVVAMEPEMVAAHIEAAYGDLVEKLGAVSQSEQSFDLGWRFLEKVVQLPLTLPSVGETPALTFFTSLFPGEDAAAGASQAAPDEAAVAVAAQQLQGASLSGAVEHGDRVAELGGAQREAVKEAVRRVVERQLSGDSPDVQEVVRYAARYLDANPREIKRFVNVFRYFVMISTERRLQGLGEAMSLEALAKLAVLTIRWPGLITPLAERVGEARARTTVFALLEAAAPTTKAATGRLSKTLASCGLGEETVQRLLAGELSEFLRAPPHVGAGADGFL